MILLKSALIVASVISFIEWFNKENIEYLRTEKKCEVHIACNCDYMDDTDPERAKAYIHSLSDEGVIFHNIHFARNPFTASNISAAVQLKRIIDGIGFDLIHCHTPTASIITRLCAIKARKSGTTVIYTCHGFHFHDSAPKINWIVFYPIERICSRFCDYLLTINREDYERAKRFRAGKVRYIPGVGVDTEKIANITIDKAEYRRKIGVPEDAFFIISAGEMIARKNHEVIIRALGQINDSGIYYAICGKGPLKEKLQRLARKLHIENNVIFLGFRNDIAELYHTADISAFPSKTEGLGLAGIEALAAGIPLVSSGVHGIVDYMTDGKTGFVCDCDNINAFSEAIRKLSEETELRNSMKENCIRAAAPFDRKIALRCMWNIYDEILSGIQ